jgi:small subunit ribosomal protein S4e
MHKKSVAAGLGKKNKWTTTVKSSHKNNESLPLTKIIQSLGHADKALEAKKIIAAGHVLLNGKTVKKPRQGAGLMDLVSIPSAKEDYILVPTKKGLTLKEIPGKNTKTRLLRVIGKKTLSKGKTQLNFHDGTNIIAKEDVKVNDTVEVETPKPKIKQVISFDTGATALIVSGRHRGETGKIKEVLASTGARPSLTTVNEIQTLTEYVFVIGKEKPLIEL